MHTGQNKNQAIKENTKAVWGASPAGWTFGKGYEKGSKEFFDAVVKKRFIYECDWLDEIVDFKRHAGKKVLEIGCGAGYDAYMFCKHGALYTGIDITPDNSVITKKHLAFYGYEPVTLEADAEKISFKNEFDYVYSFGVLHHVPDIEKALKNIFAALKPGGEAQIIVYHKNSIFYRISLAFADWFLGGKFRKMTLADRLSQIEYTTSDAKPLVRVYSRREIQNLMKHAGFMVQKIEVRKLVHEDLPDIPVIRRLYKYIPDSWLKFLGKKFGWYVSVRATKSLS